MAYATARHGLAEVMARLEAAGTSQSRQVFPRHGAKGPLFGVPFGELERLRKAIGTDHTLAQSLWASGNADARQLACRVADPRAARDELLEAWARDLDWYALADAFAKHRVRYAMNDALIAIGTLSDDSERKALQVARAIGRAEVDHGETGCKTPDAASAIPKARQHRHRKGD